MLNWSAFKTRSGGAVHCCGCHARGRARRKMGRISPRETHKLVPRAFARTIHTVSVSLPGLL